MDAVTAVSGSGPAYFFYLVEAMVEAGVKLGLPHDAAFALARQTAFGAGKLLVECHDAPEDPPPKGNLPRRHYLRRHSQWKTPASKGLVIAAIEAAAVKAKELGR